MKAAEVHIHCLAPTKRLNPFLNEPGMPCRRRVRAAGDRCYQHKGYTFPKFEKVKMYMAGIMYKPLM